MSEIIMLMTGALSILVIIFLAMILYKGRKTSKAKVRSGGGANRNAASVANVVAAPGAGGTQEAMRVGNRRVIRSRPRRRVNENENSDDEFSRPRNNDSENDDDNGSDTVGDDIALPGDGGKIGAKKRKKLEMKAEKRAARERELEEREERKQRQAALDEKRRVEEEKAKAEEKAREEAERLEREEKERREHEEYLKLKESFAVEEEGYEENDTGAEGGENKLKIFIDYIKENKVVLLEDLAGQFQMKTQDVINRVNDLLEQQLLVGVIDDRGKFIYINHNELESIAKFIKRRGRISITELVESSNTLIKLQPTVQLKT